ncbi:MAG TPA: amidohydrolase family protein [Acidimicrobiales bacterium]|nr:amidohydrolase family protein [Acidimicrobiales bacterium]
MTDLASIPIIDTDTHILEPPDLWTSRMSSRWGDLVPHVRWHEPEGGGEPEEYWFVGDRPIFAGGRAAQFNWPEFCPEHPLRFEDADPACWDPGRRLRWMDEAGVHAQVLYSNVAMFSAGDLVGAEAAFTDECIRAYNDFQTEWSSVAPDRLLPMTQLPFWNLDWTLAEMERCAAAGHRGIVFSQEPANFGLPALADPYWDRLWAAAQEMRLPVNFHIASGDNSLLLNNGGYAGAGLHANFSWTGVWMMMGNLRTISQLIVGGVCHRFPDLNFVSVESGVGWLPFALEALDWQWRNCGVPQEHPEFDLLPSEYFKRQIYGCFWFETDVAMAAIDLLGADNILYETDFPHATSMTPGPASVATMPREHIATHLSGLPEATLRKVLHDNAARLYGLG